jgi:hypothetical protein
MSITYIIRNSVCKEELRIVWNILRINPENVVFAKMNMPFSISKPEIVFVCPFLAKTATYGTLQTQMEISNAHLARQIISWMISQPVSNLLYALVHYKLKTVPKLLSLSLLEMTFPTNVKFVMMGTIGTIQGHHVLLLTKSISADPSLLMIINVFNVKIITFWII